MRSQSDRIERARGLLTLISEAAFVNPFSARRHDLDGQLLGADAPEDRAQRIERVLERVREALTDLERQAPLDLRRLDAPDRTLLLRAVLFDAFHAWAYDFDAHIEAQLAAGDRPLEVPFAEAALEGLLRRGVAAEEAARGFAFFFQLRRAY